jgi:FlaA1/EpsC-like NDP-sugar epimerase
VAILSIKKNPLQQALTRLGQKRHQRSVLFLAGDVTLISAALLSARMLASGSWVSMGYSAGVVPLLALSLAIKIPLLQQHRLYNMSWNYASTRELAALIRAVSLGSLMLGLVVTASQWLTPGVLPKAGPALAIDYLLTITFLGGFRSAKRLTREWFRPKTDESLRPVLIVGAGDAGEQVARRLYEEANPKYRAVGFVDDADAKQGTSLHGVPVLGARKDIPALARRLQVEEMWIAMPSCPGPVVRQTVDLGRSVGLRQIKILPGLDALINGELRLGDLRQVQLEDLLARDKVHIDAQGVAASLQGKRVLVTGAAGSIGSELCRQIARFGPATLVLLDQDETGLFNIENQMAQQAPQLNTRGVVGSICDSVKIERVFQEFRPEIVFHAAAYKHVPLMESHPEEAIRTNVMGTRTVGRAAVRWGTKQFVLISTDKAVNPSSVMGATKRAAEVVIQDLNRAEVTQFVAVRFGNVLGSRGSVVPTFQEQIARGGPVTVTDPEMKRYFMTVEEAVMLVLQSAVIGEGGSVLVLDMGEPVKIVELARHLIRLSGLEPDRDIPIVFTGARPGEKLFEDLLTAEEGTSATCHERVFLSRMNTPLNGPALETCLAQLEQGVLSNSRPDMMVALQTLVPTNQLNKGLAGLAPSLVRNGASKDGVPQAVPPSGARPGAVPRTNPAIPESS